MNERTWKEILNELSKQQKISKSCSFEINKSKLAAIAGNLTKVESCIETLKSMEILIYDNHRHLYILDTEKGKELIKNPILMFKVSAKGKIWIP